MITVYLVDTTELISRVPGGPARSEYKTTAAARAARSRFLKTRTDLSINDVGMIRSAEFHTVEKKMTVINLMTKQPVEIPVNTPWSCNPASEAYWSR